MSVTDILSIQLYTLRTLEDLDLILDTVADAGYLYVETVGSHLDKAAEVRSKLDARGLKASSSHVSMAALREKPDAIVEACRTLASRISTCRPCPRRSATWQPTAGARSGMNSDRSQSAFNHKASASATTTIIGS